MSTQFANAVAKITPQYGPLKSVEWLGGLDDGRLRILDQTRLPGEIIHREITGLEQLRTAIIDLAVRGAPAIGIAGAYGVVLHLIPVAKAHAGENGAVLETALDHAVQTLVTSRPTAVNLRWALERLREVFHRHTPHLAVLEMCARLLLEAKRLHREDAELCARIAENGASILPEQGGIYTHGHAGALATGGVGTALGCLVAAHQAGKRIHVYAGETRPLLQGARLTAPELKSNGVPLTLTTDSMAGLLMAQGRIEAVIVGAARIAANGDTANEIGTYPLAVLARHHGIPFYVAAPYSTFDLSLRDGAGIVIEERQPAEIRAFQGAVATLEDIPVANPAFDVTPANLITAIITERGVIRRPTAQGVAALMGDDRSEPAV